MTNGHIPTNGVRAQPMYTFKEAAHLAEVSPGTVRNWLFGYVSGERSAEPLFNVPSDQGPMVSFLQLIEIVVAGRFRKAEHLPLQTIRQAYENAQQQFSIQYPFAHLRLEAIGGHIVQRMRGEHPGASLQALDQPTQWTLPGLVIEVVHQLEYEQDLAARWYPIGKDVPIVVDPRISAGIPTFTGRGVTIEAIHKRWKAGYKIDFIARDFELEPPLVETALQYAERVAA